MLNTLVTAQRLTQSGMPREQAEALTMAINEGLTNTAATKEDLGATEQMLSGKIQATEQTLRGEIKATEQRLNTKIDAVEQTLRGEIKATEQRLDAKIDAVEQTLRGEIKATEQRLDAKIDAVEQRLEAKIESAISNLKISMLKWMFAMFLAQTTVIIAIMALLLKR